MDPFSIAMVAVVGGFVVTIAIVFLIARSRLRRLEIQAQVQTKLIERFGSSAELVDFLQSPMGREFVTGVQSVPMLEARERVIAGVRRAIVLAALGIGFIALGMIYKDALYFPGFILLALGGGYAVASWVSIRLSHSLQLGSGAPPRRDGDST